MKLYLLVGLGTLIAIPIVALVIIFETYTVPTSSMANTVMPGDLILAESASFITELPERGEIVVFRFPGNRDVVTPDVEEVYLERCVAVAGDILEVREGVAYVNGRQEDLSRDILLPSAYDGRAVAMSDKATRDQIFPKGSGFTRDNWGPMRIPARGDTIDFASPAAREAWTTFIEREGHSVGFRGKPLIDGRVATSYIVENDYVFGMGDNRINSLDSRYWGFIPTRSIEYTAERILVPGDESDRFWEPIQ